MAPRILNKLRRRQSLSLARSQPQSYIHHASTPPEWPTSPAQATPDVYITSPPEEDGLLTSVCVHRALEHEPKKLRKQEDRASMPLPPAVTLNDPSDIESPPAFRRASLQSPDVVLPTKRTKVVTDEAGRVQFDEKNPLVRVSSGREDNIPKSKTLRHRASKVFKSFANRESLNFGSEKRHSHPEGGKRRNTLSDSSRPAFASLAHAATAHAMPAESSTPPVARASVEGRRRSSTLGHVEFTPRPESPPRPPLPADVAEAPIPTVVLDPAVDIVEPTSPKADKPRKLQRKRSKNAFSQLFHLKSDKPRSSPTEQAVPEDIAKTVADADTPDVVQSSAPASATTTPKSSKSKRFKRSRRATIGSVSQIASEFTGIPPSMSTVAQPDTPNTPTSLRSRPFSIVDLRKGFSVRGIGKGKGKLLSAKSSPTLGSPASIAPASEVGELPETVMQRYKMSRPPPLQPTDLPILSGCSPVPANEATNNEHTASPTTVEFEAPDNGATQLPSPTESDGPVTPMFGAQEESRPTLDPAAEPDEPKAPEQVPELSFTPPTSEESSHNQGQVANRPSTASEATLLCDDPLFSSLDAPSSIGSLELQLREPTTKTSTLDAHLQLGSLRFDNFSFDTNVF